MSLSFPETYIYETVQKRYDFYKAAAYEDGKFYPNSLRGARSYAQDMASGLYYARTDDHPAETFQHVEKQLYANELRIFFDSFDHHDNIKSLFIKTYAHDLLLFITDPQKQLLPPVLEEFHEAKITDLLSITENTSSEALSLFHDMTKDLLKPRYLLQKLGIKTSEDLEMSLIYLTNIAFAKDMNDPEKLDPSTFAQSFIYSRD